MVDTSPGILLVRVGEAGIDQVTETQEVTIPRSKGWPITMIVAGSAAAIAGAYAAEKYWEPTPGIGVAIGGGVVAAGGVGLLFLPPRHSTVQCPAFRARVSIDTTFIPEAGPASTSHGEADLLVDDTRLPCDEDGVVEPE